MHEHVVNINTKLGQCVRKTHDQQLRYARNSNTEVKVQCTYHLRLNADAIFEHTLSMEVMLLYEHCMRDPNSYETPSQDNSNTSSTSTTGSTNGTGNTSTTSNSVALVRAMLNRWLQK
jgi:hypothetical protein